MLAAEKQKAEDQKKSELKQVLTKRLSGLHDHGQSSSSLAHQVALQSSCLLLRRPNKFKKLLSLLFRLSHLLSVYMFPLCVSVW